MLSHRNFMHQIETLPERLDLLPGQVWLSVLPVWHSFERLVQYAIIGVRATMAYSKPIGAVMLPDFQAIKPQWMASVPRIWESVQEGVYRSIRQGGKFKLGMFNLFVSVGKSWAHHRNKLQGRLPNFGHRSRAFDVLSSLLPLLLLAGARGLGELLVFKKIKAKLGGKFIAGVSGGGAMPPAVDNFFDAIGIKVIEGYGLTETAPVVAVRAVRKPVMGTVGQALRGTEFRIVDDEGRELGRGKKGNIQIRGPQVMMGYYKRPDLGAKVKLADGWLATGDLGMLTTHGELKITGRAKDTIVLRGGENVEPVPIEQKLMESQYVKQAVVLGQDMKFLAALIVPEQEAVTQWAKENNIPIVDYETLLGQPEVRELVDFEINQLVNQKNGFKSFERIFRFELLPTAFEVDKELSAKQEVKRHAVAEIYKHEIQRLFKD
jgi:long-chain acyl-CoA synthetase